MGSGRGHEQERSVLTFPAGGMGGFGGRGRFLGDDAVGDGGQDDAFVFQALHVVHRADVNVAVALWAVLGEFGVADAGGRESVDDLGDVVVVGGANGDGAAWVRDVGAPLGQRGHGADQFLPPCRVGDDLRGGATQHGAVAVDGLDTVVEIVVADGGRLDDPQRAGQNLLGGPVAEGQPRGAAPDVDA